MAFTAKTVENLTTVTATANTAATDLFIPSKAGDNRYRFRVVRAVFQGCTGGDNFTITGITNTGDDSGQTTETQTLAILVCGQGTGAAAAVVAATDTVGFPDECEFRGRIQLADTVTTGTATLFLHHG